MSEQSGALPEERTPAHCQPQSTIPDQMRPSVPGLPFIVDHRRLPGGDAVEFMFSRLFSNRFLVYFLVSLACLAVNALSAVPILLIQLVYVSVADRSFQDEDVAEMFTDIRLLVTLLSFMLTFTVLQKAAIAEARGVRPDRHNVFKNVPWGRGFLVNLLAWCCFILGFAGILALPYLLGDGVLTVVLMVLVATAFSVLLLPFVLLIPFYAIDGRASVLGAVAACFRDVRPHYWRVVALTAGVSLVTNMASVITLGASTVLIYPVTALTTVFMYRWISEWDQPWWLNEQFSQPPQQPAQ